MADLNFGVNHPLAVKLWSRKLFYESLKGTWAFKFMGTTPNSLCQILDDTQKQAGDKITWGLRRLLSGAGVSGDNQLEGNEEALDFYSDAVTINQLRHATSSKGKMSEQRVPYALREEIRDALGLWYQDRIDTMFFNQLAGNTGEVDERYYGFNAPIAPDANHLFISSASGSDTAEASLSATTSFCFRLRDIDRAVTKAKTMSIPIKPIKMNGGEYYVMFLHPYSVYQLRIDVSTTYGPSWEQIQEAAIQGGQITKNPLFTGALGLYNRTILHESTRVPFVPGSTVNVRNIFAGAQSLALAFGQGFGPSKMKWVEKKFDYDNRLGVACGFQMGMKKAVFNSADFGTIVVSSYAPPV